MPHTTTYFFIPFRLVPDQRLLTVDDKPLKLGGRAFDTLLALVERRDRTVSKHELLDVVWPRLVVEENNLQVQIVALRKLLGHPAIATVPGRGYRFTLPVEVESPHSDDGSAATGSVAAAGAPEVAASVAGDRSSASNVPNQRGALYGRDDDM
ncbi:MAG: winged helix-turn-helix domain-containing protein, partial [Caldimonas sp.]